MSVKKTDLGTAWTNYDIWKDFKAAKLDIRVPQPDFSGKTSTEFAAVQMTKSGNPILIRHNKYQTTGIPSMPTMAPEMLVQLPDLFPNTFGLSPIHYEWHHRQLEKARARETDMRQIARMMIEKRADKQHADQVVARSDEVRAYFLATKRKNSDRQSDILVKSSFARRDNEIDNRELLSRLRDVDRQKELMFLFMKNFAPSTYGMKEWQHKKQTEPTLAQIMADKDYKISPFEFLISSIAKKIPFIKKAKLAEIFANYAELLNHRTLLLDNAAVAQDKVSKMFLNIFMRNANDRNNTTAAGKTAHFKAQEFREYHANRMFENNRADHAKMLDRMDRADYEQGVKDIHLGRDRQEIRVDKKYRKHTVEMRDFHAKMDSTQYVSVMGEGTHVQKDPTKFMSQYGIVKTYVKHSADLREQTSLQIAERTDMMVQNRNKYIRSLYDRMVEYNDEVNLFRQVLRMRNFIDRMQLQSYLPQYFEQMKLYAITAEKQTAAAEMNASYGNQMVQERQKIAEIVQEKSKLKKSA